MRRRRILGLAAIVAAAGVGFFALYAPSTPPQVVTLSDGTRLTVRGVTVSRHPRFCFGNALQKIGAKFPGKLGMKLGGSSVCDLGRFENPVLAIWLSCETNFPRRVVFRDSSDRPWMHQCFWSVAGSKFGCIRCEVWPRRDKTLALELWANYLPPEKEPDARLVIPNPAYAKYPQWTPEILPATRRVGETEFTLQSVKVERLRTVSNADRFFHKLSISTRTTEHGEPTEAWEATSLAMADATGNSVERLGWVGYPDRGYWPAMPGEEAVGLRVEFVKTNGFASNNVFVLRGVPGPGPPYRFVTNLPAGRLVLRTTPDQVVAVEPTYSGVDTNWSSRHFVLLSVIDDRGFNGFIEKPGARAHILPGAKRFDITVAAPPVQWVEWIVPTGGTVTNIAAE